MDTLPPPPRGERGRKQISSICPLDEMARTCAKKESAAALLFFSQQHQNNAVHNARERAEHDDWPRDDEHLRRHAGDEALWLCQDRHTAFSEFFSRLQSGGAYCFSLPLQMQTRSKYAYLSQSLLKGTHEPALQNF